MLIFSKEEEWGVSYQCAAHFLSFNSVNLAKLGNIQNNPACYVGYYLHNIEGNMDLKDNVASEKNICILLHIYVEGVGVKG